MVYSFSLDIRAETATAAIRNRTPEHVLIVSIEDDFDGATVYNVVYDNDHYHTLHRLEDAMYVYGYTRGQGIACTLDIA